MNDRLTAATRPERDRRRLLDLLGSVLSWSRRRQYTGWDYADGMSSRIRRGLPVDNRWVNLLFQETAKRAPVNVRPLLLVEQRRNFMGAALFAMANLTMARQRRALEDGSRREDSPAIEIGAPVASQNADATEEVDYVAEARGLLEWLVANRCRGYSGFCGGHRHQVQAPSGRGYPDEPDAVSTAQATRALLDGGDLDPRYPALARTAADFVLDDLNYRRVEGGAVVDYHQGHPEDSYTINAGALAARALLDVYDRFGGEVLRVRAREILDHVASLQTEAGGWYYREPPSASHLSMDTHHNGFVIECFQRYHAVADDRYSDTLDRALSFFREVSFEADGAPNFEEERAYPRDVHASAQGILVFSYAGEFAFARRILQWTLRNLYAGDGRFYYRKQRLYTKRYTLMRWCQAWMAYAIAEHVAERFGDGGVGTRIGTATNGQR